MADETAVRFFKFKWKIQEFSLSRKPFGECHRSPVFEVGPVKFYLSLYPRGKERENYIALFINRSREEDAKSPEEISVDTKFEIRNTVEGLLLWDRHTSGMKLNKYGSFGYEKFIEREQVINTDRNLYLPDDTLTVCIKMIVIYQTDSGLTHVISPPEELDNLSSDLKHLLEKEILSDLTVKAIGGSVKGHRSVLLARAPKLAEKLMNTEELATLDMEVATLRALLLYLYTGKLNTTYLDLPYELCEVAELYELKDLHRHLLPNLMECSARSRIIGEYITFNWSITNFPSRREGDRVLSSFVTGFSTTTLLKFIFSVEKNEYNEDVVVFYLRRTSANRNQRYSTMFVAGNIGIVDNEGRRSDSQFLQHLYTSEEDWKVQYVTKSRIMSQSEDLLVNNTITFEFDFLANDKDDVSEINGVNYASETTDFNNVAQLAVDLENKMLHDSSNCDVTFASQNVHFPVHRCILAARSPVFERMFRHDMSEEISIPDITADTIDRMFTYIYTGNADIYSYEIAENLYKAADKYEMENLKEKCRNRLKDFISEGFAIRVLSLGEEHSDYYLKLFAENFICSNAADILETPEWRRFLSKNSELSVYILRRLTLSVKEKLSGNN